MGATARRLRRPVTDQTGVGGTAPRARACPGQLSASSGLRPIRTRRAATRSGGPYGWSLHGCNRAPASQPQQAPERRPGPPAGCPHAVREARGTLPRIPFTFLWPGGAYLRDGRHRGPRTFSGAGARAAAATRGRRSPRSPRARGRRLGVRDHLRPLLRGPAGLLRAHARQSPGGGGCPTAQLRLGVSGSARRRGRHRAAPLAVHDRAQSLPLGPAGAARAGLRRRAGGRARPLRGDVGPGSAPGRPA